MGIASEEQWPVDALLLAVAAGGFADSQDVRLIEAGVEGRPAVSRSAKGDTLGFDARVGLELVVRGQQPVDVHQLGRVGHTPGRGADLGHRLKPYPSRRAPLQVAGMTPLAAGHWAVAGAVNPNCRLLGVAVPATAVSATCAPPVTCDTPSRVVNVASLHVWPGAPVERFEQLIFGVGANAMSKTGTALVA